MCLTLKDIRDGSLSCQVFTLPFRSLGNTKISWRLAFNGILAGIHLHQNEVTNKNSDGCIQAMTCGFVTAGRAVSGLCMQLFHIYSNNLRTDWKRDVCNCIQLWGFPSICVGEKWLWNLIIRYPGWLYCKTIWKTQSINIFIPIWLMWLVIKHRGSKICTLSKC